MKSITDILRPIVITEGDVLILKGLYLSMKMKGPLWAPAAQGWREWLSEVEDLGIIPEEWRQL